MGVKPKYVVDFYFVTVANEVRCNPEPV